MVPLADIPLFTDSFELDDFAPTPGAAFVHGMSGEARSTHTNEWDARASGVDFVQINELDDSAVRLTSKGVSRQVSLRSSQQLEAAWKFVCGRPVYLDITGLSHHVWAPMLKAALRLDLPIRVVYVEPIDYRFTSTPTESEIFDLSEKIRGIAPIPGFVTLSEYEEEKVCFVPLLGFEGTRFAYLLEQVQPPGGKIVPIVGVPGFRMEYPFHTFHGNRVPLMQHGAWKSVRFAIANCAFSAYFTLKDIASKYPGDLIKIAPIGTKPHALGAVLFSLTAGRSVELVYDHPIRKASRTTGAARVLVFHVSAFLVGRKSA